MPNQIEPRHLSEEQNKNCAQCGLPKPVSAFYSDPRKAGRLRAACKNCVCKKSNEWKSRHEKQRQNTAKNYYQEHKADIAEKRKSRRIEIRNSLTDAIKVQKKCNVLGCNAHYRCSGFCTVHYDRWLTNGDPLLSKRKPNYAGTVMSNGYVTIRTKKENYQEHIKIAETVLGKKPPAGAVIHHVNKKRSDNKNNNLVICQNAAYHNLLHMRMRAVENGYPPHFRKCTFCKKYDDPVNLFPGRPYHRKCRKDYCKINHKANVNAAIA